MESTNYKKHTWIVGTVALGAVAFAAITFGLSNLDAIKHPNGQVAQITVVGEGESTAIPNIATVTFTVRESAKTVPEAQKLAQAKIEKGLKALSDLGVDAKKDVKTLSYNVNPKYETESTAPCSMYSCPPTKTVVNGYEVYQSVSVKVRKVDQAGDVIGLLGKAEITEISGPDFTVDDMDSLKAEAKIIAIKKAQAKAEEEAKALGVSLGVVMSFNEDNGGYYPTMMYSKAMSVGGVAEARDAVSLPQGENVIKSRVTITYTIK
jgi:uncharacterized protein YggE